DPATNRALVAQSVGWRRRRGTLATLEAVLSATSGWSAEVDEGFRSLAFTQDHRSPTPERGRLPAIWDPIPLADPLSRRPARADHPRDEAVARALELASEDLRTRAASDAVLRRLGRADAGRHATSPRTLDLRGWARPEAVLIRVAKLFPVELEGVVPGRVFQRDDGRRVVTLDPLGRGGPMLWRAPLERADSIPELTARHEPARSPSEQRRATTLLTPTALAADPDAVEASGDVLIALAGIPLIGPPPLLPPREPLPVQPAGASPDLRLADSGRFYRGQRWTFTLLGDRSAGPRPLLEISHASADDGGTGPLEISADARLALPGATALLRVRRSGGDGARRAPGGGWSAEATSPAPGTVRSPAVAVRFDDLTWIVRAESVGGELVFTRRSSDAPGAWVTLDASGDPLPPDQPGLALVASGSDESAHLVGDDGSGSLGVWRVTLGADATATIARLDDPAQRRPRARFAPATCLLDGTLFVFGGFVAGLALSDLWSLDTTRDPAVAFRFVHVRSALGQASIRSSAPVRAEASLLSAFGGLVLVGGQALRGQLEASVWFCDPASVRPTWRALASLPLAQASHAAGNSAPDPSGRTEHSRSNIERLPGCAVARVSAAGIEALVWADRTRPRRLTLADRAASWQLDAPEPVASAAPPPPASGEGLFLPDGTLLVIGPPPLPPSEVIVTLGARSELAYLPALDLADGAEASFALFSDGTSRRLRPDGDWPEFERGPYEPLEERPGQGRRLGVPGRLGRHTFVLRQRVLGAPGDPAWLPDRDDVVGLDTRSARVILPAGTPLGDISVSYVVGRGGPIGAGAVPPGQSVPAHLEEPDRPAPTPPSVPTVPGQPPLAEVSAWVSPARAGETLEQRGRTRPIVASLGEALDQSRDVEHPVLALLGSARVEPVHLETRFGRGLSIVAADAGSTPIISAPDDADLPSLALYSPAVLGNDADGLEDDPATAVWLAGLWVAGRTDCNIARGRVDARFCTLGTPGSVALRVAGAGHQGLLGRRSLHPIELELRLYGCQLGAIELPPWVRLIAAGCTFDAGADDVPAIDAAGARVQLRHCTVRGQTLAGELRASSGVFAGAVRVDRPDLGWLRYSLLRPAPEQPRRHHCLEHTPSFGSVRALDPTYLVLADNNGALALAAGEAGRIPGAYADRSARERELAARTEQNLPIGLLPIHLDRTPYDLARMGRRAP
ncbi:MAG TPA: hypothetical protein VMG12_16985, partial [Polyangiaceae bacterium]|nr:hypothetical protein [Polyangiaceae bacterium]